MALSPRCWRMPVHDPLHHISMTRPITFVSDYGTTDEFVGVVHAVIVRLCPDARVIDLSHHVPRQAVLPGALLLARALPYAPAGVHLAVVDPDVGARRRAVAVRTAEDDRLLVGPDNGLLLLAADRFGGVVEAIEISHSPWRLEPVSATFHGRDIFAPVSARLAAGEPLGDAGAPLDPAELVRVDAPRPRRENTGLLAHALYADGFGNLALDATCADLDGTGIKLGRPVRLAIGGHRVAAVYVRTFADVQPGELLLYEDATGQLALAVNGGEALAELGGVEPGAEVLISPH
jgi:S-adenosyl-L-methionine hydrolase (adenosine-forming)